MTAMGKALTTELPEGTVEMVIANIGMPQNARSLLVSPNVAPNTGFLRLAFSDPEERKLSQGEIAAKRARDPHARVPGRRGRCSTRAASSPASSPTGTRRRSSSRCTTTTSTSSTQQAKAVADVARTVPGIRDVRESLQIDYPEIHVDTDREKAGLVGVEPARRRADDARRDARQHQHARRVDRRAQRPVVLRRHRSTTASQVTDTQALGELAACASATPGKPVAPRRLRQHAPRASAPSPSSATTSQRVAHVLMQTEGRDLGVARQRRSRRRLKSDPRTRDIDFRFVGQVELMRTTFSGLGLALGLAVMVVFMIMASQFKSLRLPFVMLFTIPVSLVGIVLALMAAGQGFSITALMGILMVIGIAVSNGILLVDDANRRFNDEGVDAVDAIVAAARSRFVPIAMTSLATVIGLIPTALGLERGSEANQPLALAVVGGLTSSTLLSLFLVPVMFLFFAKRTPDEDEAHAAHRPLAEAPAQ